MADAEKTWWAPVWQGLVVDPEGRHYRRMGSALWLYLYFVLHADRRTGRLVSKLSTIARRAGFPRRTIQRWLKRLLAHGYVSARKTGRGPEFGIMKWKSLRRATEVAPQRRQGWRP